MSTLRIGLLFLWSVLHSSIYGFHITVLNGVQDVVICQAEGDQRSRYGLRGCLDLSVGGLQMYEEGSDLSISAGCAVWPNRLAAYARRTCGLTLGRRVYA